MMDKNGYLLWLNTRSENPSLWSRSACVEADRLIEREALANLSARLLERKIDKVVADFVQQMAKAEIGTIEVDQLLTHLNCYPEWVERA